MKRKDLKQLELKAHLENLLGHPIEKEDMEDILSRMESMSKAASKSGFTERELVDGLNKLALGGVGMKRKEKPFDPHLIELSDKQLEEQKKREREQRIKDKVESIKYSPWFDRGRR